jgi:hypothetical protein
MEADEQPDPPTVNARSMARVALVGFGVQGIGLVAIHALSTGYDPTVHFVSEYANGPHAGILLVTALGSVVGILALLGALTSRAVTPKWSAAFVLLLVNVATRPILHLFPVDSIEAAFSGGSGPQFTTAGWIHAIVGMIAAIVMMIAIILITVRLVRAGRLRGAYYSLILLAVLGPALYLGVLATRPATFPAGLYQRGFIGCTWLWLVIVSVALMSGPLAANTRDHAREGP